MAESSFPYVSNASSPVFIIGRSHAVCWNGDDGLGGRRASISNSTCILPHPVNMELWLFSYTSFTHHVPFVGPAYSSLPLLATASVHATLRVPRRHEWT